MVNCTPTQPTHSLSVCCDSVSLSVSFAVFVFCVFRFPLFFYSPLYSESDFAADRRFDSADISDTMFAFVSDCRLCSNGT